MRRAIATVTLSGSLPEKLAAMAAAGFEAVEVFEPDLLGFAGTARQAGAMAAGLGLRVACYGPLRDFEGLRGAARREALDAAERRFDAMQELGCPLLLVCSSVSPEATGDMGRIAEDLREIAERAGRRGLRVGYEALSWGRHVHDHRQAWEAVVRAGHPALGLVLDSFHILARGDAVSEIRWMDPGRIFLVQVADAPRLEMDLLPWSRHHRCFPGEGDLDLDGFMDALTAAGYEGTLSLEIFSDRLRATPPGPAARAGERSLRSLMDAARARASGGVAGRGDTGAEVAAW